MRVLLFGARPAPGEISHTGRRNVPLNSSEPLLADSVRAGALEHSVRKAANIVAHIDRIEDLLGSANPGVKRLSAPEVAMSFESERDRQRAPKWELRSVDPGPVRIPTGPLTPSRETVGVVWEGQPVPLETFLELAGEQGWEIAAAGNTGERHHRLYLKRLKLAS